MKLSAAYTRGRKKNTPLPQLVDMPIETIRTHFDAWLFGPGLIVIRLFKSLKFFHEFYIDIIFDPKRRFPAEDQPIFM